MAAIVRALRLIERAQAHEEGMLQSRAQAPIQDALTSVQRSGLIAITVAAACSLIATFVLLSFITYRLFFWKGNYSRYIGFNQYIILIYQLLLADLQQAVGFLISISWLQNGSIKAPSSACFLQGWWIQIGDPSSGIFVLAIAAHTFCLVTMNWKIPYRTFVMIIVSIWVFVLVLVAIPTASHGLDTYIPSGAWCWINQKYEAERLWTHYIWIFLAEFGTVVLYAIMFVQLQRRIKNSAILGRAQQESLRRLKRVVLYMIIYPIAYIILSLPLAAGRMSASSGKSPDMTYFCVAGAMMSCSGLVDTVLYTLTRKALLLDSEPGNSDHPGYALSHSAKNPNHTTTITGRERPSRFTEPFRAQQTIDEDATMHDRHGSTDDIVPKDVDMGKVYQQTTIQITSEPAFLERGSNERPHSEASGSGSDSTRVVDSNQKPVKGESPLPFWKR